MNSKTVGNRCEDIICSYLADKKYKILCRNFRVPGGEIDIIASFGSIICAVEVKSMSKNWDETDIEYKISPHKKLNIKKTFAIYLANNTNLIYSQIRFDVATVCQGEVKYYEGAF